jgi:diguanylate cyclase (GGDEF)-like protein
MLVKKSYFLFWLSTILVSGFLGTSILSYFVSSRTIRDNIAGQALPMTSDNVYSEIQKDIVRPIFISSQMAHNTFLQDWVLGGEQDITAITRYLQQIKQEHTTITAFLISEKTRRYYYTQGLLETVSESDPRDKWFFRVRSMRDPFEINVDPDKANANIMTIFINYRMLDYRGQFIGVTGVGLTLDNMRKVIETYEQRFDRRIYFVNRAGQIVLASGLSPDSAPSIRTQVGIEQIADRILTGTKKPLSLEYHRSDSSLGMTTILVNSRYIPELGWYLIVEQDEGTAIQPLRNVLFINLGVSALVTALMLALVLPRVHSYKTKLEKAAATDPLTGLLNRKAFDQLFSDYRQEAIQDNLTFSAVIFDIDHFKQVNDSYGHLSGDAVIKTVSEIAQHAVRQDDWIVRWGGEEFILLLKHCGLEEAKRIAEKIRTAVEAHRFQFGDASAIITISLGVATYRPSETSESFFARTDSALFLAKQKGRNRVES